MTSHDKRASLRLPVDLLQRIKRVRLLMEKKGRGLTYNESDVIRTALVRGLDALEDELKGRR